MEYMELQSKMQKKQNSILLNKLDQFLKEKEKNLE